MELSQHRVPVQQGNVLTEESIHNLRVGLEPKQVLFLLGTPLVEDPFRADRWDYPFFTEATNPTEVSRLDLISLRFEDGKLKKIYRLVPIDPDISKIEARGEMDTETEWFELSDATVMEEMPTTDTPTTDTPPTDTPPTDMPPTDTPPTDIPPTDTPPTVTVDPEIIEEKMVVEPEEAPRE